MIIMAENSDIKWHEKFAKASFNKTWDLMFEIPLGGVSSK
jgi:hypothetical protein